MDRLILTSFVAKHKSGNLINTRNFAPYEIADNEYIRRLRIHAESTLSSEVQDLANFTIYNQNKRAMVRYVNQTYKKIRNRARFLKKSMNIRLIVRNKRPNIRFSFEDYVENVLFQSETKNLLNVSK